MLWIGLLARDTGVPASTHLQIKDEVVALDFNLAVTLRLSRYDVEVMKAQAKRTAYEVNKSLSGNTDDDDYSEDVQNLVSNDPYADENTVIN